MAKTKVETKTYKSEKDYRKDLTKRLQNGWTVQSDNVTEHRGGGKYLFFGLFAFMMGKKKHHHVTYVREG